VSEYTLPHGLKGEQQRLVLMSSLLDPIELVCIARLEVGPGWRCLEGGCGMLEEFHTRYQNRHYWSGVHHLHSELATQPE
jgi:hypothetical protein